MRPQGLNVITSVGRAGLQTVFHLLSTWCLAGAGMPWATSGRLGAGGRPGSKMKLPRGSELPSEPAKGSEEDEQDPDDAQGAVELEAESSAYVVCQAIGLDSSDYSFGYVATWAGGGGEAIAAIKSAGANIHRAADFILGQLQEAAGDRGLTTDAVAA